MPAITVASSARIEGSINEPQVAIQTTPMHRVHTSILGYASVRPRNDRPILYHTGVVSPVDPRVILHEACVDTQVHAVFAVECIEIEADGIPNTLIDTSLEIWAAYFKVIDSSHTSRPCFYTGLKTKSKISKSSMTGR